MPTQPSTDRGDHLNTRAKEGRLLREDSPLPEPFPGEFRLTRLLGSGHFGKVWLAHDLNLDRAVALKTLRLPGPSPASQNALDSLRHEARILASLRHPNIVQVHAWRQAGDDHYLVLQFVPGGSLDSRVKEHGPLPWSVAGRYIADVAEGLREVHARSIIHRDVKPANILWSSETDEALLTDFGISALLGTPGSAAGTPYFMAPEAFEGEFSPALDVYGLAATLFWLVTGAMPFQGSTLVRLLEEVGRGLPDPEPRLAGVPAAIEEIIRTGMACDPVRRPSLPGFLDGLRGALNASLADSLVQLNPGKDDPSPTALRLVVSRQLTDGSFRPLATMRPESERFLRDLKRVPPAPEQAHLRTGERLRIEVVADRPGFVTVFNLGPTGNLNLLGGPYAAGERSPSTAVQARQRLHILDVELTPPAGRERLVALWSRTPLPLRVDELRSLAEQGQVVGSGPYRATRDIVRVQQSVRWLSPEDYQAAVLELDHRS